VEAWLEGAAAWRLAELDDKLVEEVADAVELDALEAVPALEVVPATVVVVVEPLLAEDSAPWESSRPAVSARAPATLAAAAIRRPRHAGWGRR